MVSGLRELIGLCTDPNGFVREVNAELRALWEASNGYDPHAAGHLKDLERKIANIWQAIEDGITDTATANSRLATLQAEREKLRSAVTVSGERPQIDTETALSHRRQIEKTLAEGSPTEQKEVLRPWPGDIKLAPERLEVEWTYRIPEPVMHSAVAGARFVEEKKTSFRRWIVENAFRMPYRLVETVSQIQRVGDSGPE